MPSIALFGSTGQLGCELQISLGDLGRVASVARADCPLGDPAQVESCLERIAPTLIVNAAAYTAVDQAESEPDAAYAINCSAPEAMARYAERSGALLVHYSTDYVFDGRKVDPYLETDEPGPTSIYGASKLAGELAIRRSGARHLILRTSWVFGVQGQNFLKTMLRLAAAQDELQVVADQHGAPTSALWLARTTAAMLGRYLANPPHSRRSPHSPHSPALGTYHMSAAGVTTWYGYASYVIAQARARGAALRVHPDSIRAVTTDQFPRPARRPANSVLDTHALQSAWDITVPDWRVGVDEVLHAIVGAPYR